MELKGERAFTEDACTEYDLNIDDVVTKMTDIRKKIFDAASQNIKDAQVKYKDYYDKKRENPEVAIINYCDRNLILDLKYL